MSQTTTAAAPSTAAPPPSPVSLIPIDVLHGFVDLLSQPHARDTIIGTAAVNALLTAELVAQVTRIAEWHKRTGMYVLGGETPTASASTPPTGSGAAIPAAGSAPSAVTHPVSGAAPGMLTPFLADINTVVLNQLALRDTLIAGLRTDLTTAQSAVAGLKTEHAAMMAQMTEDIRGLRAAHGELTHQTSALRGDVASARAQIEPLVGRVEQMMFDLARQDVAIREIARDAASPTEVVIVQRDADPPESPEDTAEDHPRGGRPRRR